MKMTVDHGFWLLKTRGLILHNESLATAYPLKLEQIRHEVNLRCWLVQQVLLRQELLAVSKYRLRCLLVSAGDELWTGIPTITAWEELYLNTNKIPELNFSDFPWRRDYQGSWMSSRTRMVFSTHCTEFPYLKAYADHFDLLRAFHLNTRNLTKVLRGLKGWTVYAAACLWRDRRLLTSFDELVLCLGRYARGHNR
jgi:hypothetical protein